MKLFLTSLAVAVMLVACVAQAQEKGLVFAHRGGAREFDENTLAAFKESYTRGLRGFETDVRMTRDGVLVILHDNALQRTFNGTGQVEEMSAEELRPLKTKKSGRPLPLPWRPARPLCRQAGSLW